MLNVPKKAIAGTSIVWESSLLEYPSHEWGLVINIAGPVLVPTTTTPLQNGAGWLTEIDRQDLEEPGTYYWNARVVSGSGNAILVGSGSLVVLPDLAVVGEPYDGRTMARKILDGLQQAIADLSTGKISSYQIEGRGVTYRSLEELQKAEAYWRARADAEERAVSGTQRTIKTRFSY